MQLNRSMTEQFRAFAEGQLSLHTEALKKIYQSQPLNATQAKLTAFNDHLNHLKDEMLKKIKTVLDEARARSEDVDKLSVTLMKIYNEIVNDFFTRDFNHN